MLSTVADPVASGSGQIRPSRIRIFHGGHLNYYCINSEITLDVPFNGFDSFTEELGISEESDPDPKKWTGVWIQIFLNGRTGIQKKRTGSATLIVFSL